MPVSDPVGCSLASSFIPLHSATYDTSISMANRDKRNYGLYNPLPSHEAAGWLPRAVSEPAHPSGRRRLRPLAERHGGGAELRRTRCPGATQPGVPGQPRAAALLAVTALRRLITPAARLPLALLLQQRAERADQRARRPPAQRPAPSGQAALRRRLRTHRGCTRRARARGAGRTRRARVRAPLRAGGDGGRVPRAAAGTAAGTGQLPQLSRFQARP